MRVQKFRLRKPYSKERLVKQSLLRKMMKMPSGIREEGDEPRITRMTWITGSKSETRLELPKGEIEPRMTRMTRMKKMVEGLKR